MSNKFHAAFEAVHADDGLKNATLLALQQKRQSAEKKHSALWRGASLVAACAVLCFVFGLYFLYTTPVSYISIDVNPSIELELSCFNRVISATAYNEDGENVLEDLDLKGCLYTAAIEKILFNPAMKPYLKDDSLVTITVATDDTEREQTLLAGANDSTGSLTSESYSAEVASLPEAHSHGLSFGKYSAYLELSRYDDTVTTDDCRTMTMSEIHHAIESHKGHESDHHEESGANNPDTSTQTTSTSPEGTTEGEHGEGYGHNGHH